jgi:enoyl-CoA hydratase/carnithine racemase
MLESRIERIFIEASPRMSAPPAGVNRDVQFEIVGGQVAVISLDRPDKRNAVNEAVALAVAHLVEIVETDDAIRVGILTSANVRMFCAGADLAEIAAGRVRKIITPTGGFAGFTDAKRAKPWIAAVYGPVLGGGLELALACDMIVASDDATFGLPEVKQGFLAAAGGAYRLPRAIPRNIALELITTGAPIDARRAHMLGLVNCLAPASQVHDVAIGIAKSIAANAPLAVRHSLAIARQQADKSDAELRSLSVELGTAVMTSSDAREGPRAFLEKRPPRWTGS